MPDTLPAPLNSKTDSLNPRKYLVLSVGIVEFYQFGRTNISDRVQYNAYWAEENTVTASAWIKTYTNKPVYSDNTVLSRRVLAFSERAMLSETDVVNFIQGNVNGLKRGYVLRVPELSEINSVEALFNRTKIWICISCSCSWKLVSCEKTIFGDSGN